MVSFQTILSIKQEGAHHFILRLAQLEDLKSSSVVTCDCSRPRSNARFLFEVAQKDIAMKTSVAIWFSGEYRLALWSAFKGSRTLSRVVAQLSPKKHNGGRN